MRNPLMKRIPREFKGELGKYIVIFLFMILVIGFISGFLVAANSMIAAYNESFEKYNVENGHFIASTEPGRGAIDRIKDEGNVDIAEQFYKETAAKKEGEDVEFCTLRIFKKRDIYNMECLMKGEFPNSDDEIVIDRMFADNNGLAPGSKLVIAGKTLTVTGLVALSDYSSLFANNSDMMFDASKFGVAVMTDEGYRNISVEKEQYEYVWKYNKQPADTDEETDMSNELLKKVVGYVSLEDYVPRYANQAIKFTGVDFGGDSVMMKVLLYVLIVVMAFVFSITIKHTITKEASVIGTLRASGYTKGEVLRHYLMLPVTVTLISALVGNIFGYTVFKDMAASMYYGSYSLPTFVTLWNAEAFILTTVFPVIIMFIINYFTINRALRLTPLQFLRHELKKTKRKKAVRLPGFKFMNRFRIRIILQNAGNYTMLFFGIMLSNVFLLFGMMMGPLLTHYQNEIINTMPSKYQYILKTQVDTAFPQAEKYCISSVEYYADGKENQDSATEKFSVYGLEDNSKYMKFELPEEGVAISDGLKEKYGIDVGDELVVYEEYGSKEYRFKISSIVSYPGALALFMQRDVYIETFKPKMGFEDSMGSIEMMFDKLASPPIYKYFNAYFSDVELTDIKDDYVQMKITETDMTKVSRQLDISMGELFQIWNVFSIVLFVLLIYLMTKLVIEKNTNAISMTKILGYTDREIAGLYLLATTWVVIISIIISFLIATPVIVILYHFFMAKMSGWLTIWIGYDTYIKMFLLGIAAYLLVALLQYLKIRRIPMDEALKAVE